jgi:flagellar biosynthesis protein FliR
MPGLEIFQFYNNIPLFLLIFLRVSSFFVTFPMFSMTSIPPRLIVIFSFIISLFICQISLVPEVIDLFSLQGLNIALNQIFIGAFSGFVFTVIFNVFIFSGELVAVQTGLGFASMVDPHISQMNLLGQFYWLSIATLFLLMNGHLQVIHMLVESFHTLPISSATLTFLKIKTVIDFSEVIFSGTILIALPLIISLLAVNLIFSVITRSVPQLNIFSLVYPLILILGLLMAYLSFQTMIDNAGDYFNKGFEVLGIILKANS